MAESSSWLPPTSRGGLPCAAGQNSHEAAAWRLGPARKTAHVPAAARVPGALVVWSPRTVHVCDGALTDGLVVASRRQGVPWEHPWGPGVEPGRA
jgi:hypothetical protein